MKRSQDKHSMLLVFAIAILHLCSCSGFTSVGTPSSTPSTEPTTQTLAPETETSLPISYLDPDGRLVFAPDAEGLYPVVVFSDGIDFASDITPVDTDSNGDFDNTFLIVSDTKDALASNHEQKSSVWRSAWAAANSGQVCPIQTNGQVECFYAPENASPKSLFLALSDENGNLISDVVEESVQSDLFYLRATASDLTVFSDRLYAITSNIGVDLAPDSESETLAIRGDYTQNYQTFEANGTEFVYDAVKNYFGLRNSASGISILEKNSDDSFTLLDLQTNGEATAYTTFRAVGDTIYYGIAENEDDEGYLYNLYESTSHYSEILYDRVYEDIQFIATGDVDENGKQLTLTKTNFFDINNLALIVYEDGDGQPRLRASNGSMRFGGIKPLESSASDEFTFEGIQFFGEDRAVLLDSLNQKLWVIFVNSDDKFVTQHLSLYASVGKGATELTLNADKSRAYILNAADETVTIIQLTNSDGAPRYQPGVVATYALSAALPDKTGLALQPATLALTSESLFVGSNATKAVLRVALADIAEEVLPDEDYDADGYTTAQGDCDDGKDEINPAAAEICGDATDNDCNRSTDEGCETDSEDPDGFVF